VTEKEVHFAFTDFPEVTQNHTTVTTKLTVWTFLYKPNQYSISTDTG